MYPKFNFKMKNFKYALLGLVFITYSCEEEDLSGSLIEYQQKLAEYYIEAEGALSNVYTIVDLTVRDPNVMAGDTVAVMGAAVYMTGSVINIDYGNGNTGPDGITRKGLIMADQTGDYTQSGGTLDVSFDNYEVNNKKVGGVIAVNNQGNNTMALTAIDFFINEEFDLDASKTLTWNSGFNTVDDQDDEYTLDGTSTGTDSANSSVTADILSPLKFRRDCEYAVLGGVVDLSFMVDTASNTPSGTLDFLEDDGCDNLVTVKLKDGDQEVEVTLQFDGFNL